MLIRDFKPYLILLLGLIFFSCHDNPYQQGKRIYNDLCSNCHMVDGSGLKKVIPSLHQRIPLITIGQQICLLEYGINADSLGEAMNVMPNFSNISEVNMVNLINFMNKEWNTDFSEINMTQLRNQRSLCKKEKGHN